MMAILADSMIDLGFKKILNIGKIKTVLGS